MALNTRVSITPALPTRANAAPISIQLLTPWNGDDNVPPNIVTDAKLVVGYADLSNNRFNRTQTFTLKVQAGELVVINDETAQPIAWTAPNNAVTRYGNMIDLLAAIVDRLGAVSPTPLRPVVARNF